MKLQTINGDIIELAKNGEFDVLIHCQNCFHGWNKGIVTQIKKAFKTAYIADLKTIKGDKSKMGSYSIGEHTLSNGKKLYIANLYAQFSYGEGNHLKLNKLKDCLEKLNKEFSGLKIGYPLIGAGQAGGKWEDIEPVIDQALINVTHQLVVFR